MCLIPTGEALAKTRYVRTCLPALECRFYGTLSLGSVSIGLPLSPSLHVSLCFSRSLSFSLFLLLTLPFVSLGLRYYLNKGEASGRLKGDSAWWKLRAANKRALASEDRGYDQALNRALDSTRALARPSLASETRPRPQAQAGIGEVGEMEAAAGSQRCL